MTYLYALPNDKAKGVQFPGLEHVVVPPFFSKDRRKRFILHSAIDSKNDCVLFGKKKIGKKYSTYTLL